jgi:hypothetical protein
LGGATLPQAGWEPVSSEAASWSTANNRAPTRRSARRAGVRSASRRRTDLGDMSRRRRRGGGPVASPWSAFVSGRAAWFWRPPWGGRAAAGLHGTGVVQS